MCMYVNFFQGFENWNLEFKCKAMNWSKYYHELDTFLPTSVGSLFIYLFILFIYLFIYLFILVSNTLKLSALEKSA